MPRRFEVGSKVYNTQMGAGEVVAVDGYGDKEKLTINFEASGVRQILTKFFVLEPYDNTLRTTVAEATPSPGAVPEASHPGVQATLHAPASPSTGSGAPAHSAAAASPDYRSNPVRESVIGRAVPAPSGGTTGSIREALREVLREEFGAPEVTMLDRWKGGTILLKAAKAGVAEKVIPIDALFHKIVMLRDRLRVLEQKLNAHPGLGDADKVELQQYITRIYGSLTTFNILFADREDWFVGQKGSEE